MEPRGIGVGSVVDGRYRLEELVADREREYIYHATNEVIGHDVSIRILKARVGVDDAAQRVAREARSTCHLRGPNNVRVYDFGQLEDGRPWMALERMTGHTLAHHMGRGIRFSTARTVHIALQICKALHEAHEIGIVHRNLGPEQVYVTNVPGEPDFVKVAGYGVAKLMDSGHADATPTSQLMGDPSYVSPELARGLPVDHRTDLYSLGALMYALIAGRPPFEGDSPIDVLTRVVDEEPVPLAIVAPDAQIQPDFEALVARLMEKHVDRRGDSAMEVAERLRQMGAKTQFVMPRAEVSPEALARIAPGGEAPRIRRRAGGAARSGADPSLAGRSPPPAGPPSPQRKEIRRHGPSTGTAGSVADSRRAPIARRPKADEDGSGDWVLGLAVVLWLCLVSGVGYWIWSVVEG